ncbi:hypothetical protein FACS1894166_05030 [Bacilli bacterium]|nr:hypothetical protein FACS1894166_05030 [Bacilli bacterium]
MYSHVFLIAADLANALVPTTAANVADGVKGFVRAGFNFLFAILFFSYVLYYMLSPHRNTKMCGI